MSEQPKQPNEIQINLNTLEEFFAEPAADPFDPDSRYLSGIDEIAGKLRLMPRQLYNPTRLTIQLPGTAVTPTTASTLSAAVNRYCTAKIAENDQVIAEIRVSSRRQSIYAIIIAVVLMLFTILVITLVPELEQVSGAIAGFVGIAVWVIFWDPIYNYVYAWRPNYLDIKVYKNVRSAELVIKSAESK